uniref:Zinc-ribbon domain-containing protein n=1 Tax=Eubacterium cellulosolvens (strain ATCC 43171 / JCM 9499 / 6) TaxID=633697 RepID=I5AXD7_EUBC6
MFCMHCGKELPGAEASKFCPYCGASLTQENGCNGSSGTNGSVGLSKGINLSVDNIDVIRRYVFWLALFISTIGIFLPLLKVEEMIVLIVNEETMSLFELFKKYIEYQGHEYNSYGGVFFMAILISLPMFVALVLGCTSIWQALLVKNDQKAYEFASGAAIANFVGIVFLWIGSMVIHPDNYSSYSSVTLSSTVFLSIAASIITYVLASVLARKRSQRMGETATCCSGKKICNRCGEIVLIGMKCPNCGSEDVRYIGEEK